MPDLYITLALPNPLGRDRPAHSGPTQAQLNSEWIEFANVSGAARTLDGAELFHTTFDRNCHKTGGDRLENFSGGLPAGHSVRVHSGSGQIRQEGTVWHLFLNRSNYVWNNECGDTAVLRNSSGALIDWASYVPRPEEGRILRRVANTNTLR